MTDHDIEISFEKMAGQFRQLGLAITKAQRAMQDLAAILFSCPGIRATECTPKREWFADTDYVDPKLIWKIRYAFEIRKLLRLSPLMCWQMAAITVEDYGDDIDIWTPKQAAEDERDEWLACC